MIDFERESVISLVEAAKSLPSRRGGRRPHISCLYRWTTVGCRGTVLESIQIGGTRCTSREALTRFFAALGAGPEPHFAERTGRSPAQRVRESNAATRKLARMGV